TRGIPFSERTVGNTSDEVDALKRIGGDTSLPVLTIGAQRLKGYSDAEWSRYLDAAGYPAKSALPSGYRRPTATPLVPVRLAPGTPEPTTEADAPESSPPAETTVPVTPPSTNPAGIRF